MPPPDQEPATLSKPGSARAGAVARIVIKREHCSMECRVVRLRYIDLFLASATIVVAGCIASKNPIILWRLWSPTQVETVSASAVSRNSLPIR